MDLSQYSVSELIDFYSCILSELKKRGILRTKNFVGELGEYLVFEHYNKSSNLPKLTGVPVGTKNINAIDNEGMRYSIKSTSNNVSGVIYGLQPYGSSEPDIQLFEYIIICKLSDTYELKGIYQLTWDKFLKHKKWHSRMAAWNIPITQNVIADSTVIYENNTFPNSSATNNCLEHNTSNRLIISETDSSSSTDDAITWKKLYNVNHVQIRNETIEKVKKELRCNLNKESQSRYVSPDRNTAVFVLSASYSQKNSEYWYSINDETIPWLEPFPNCYIAFALGSSNQILLFSYKDLKELMKSCLKTKEDAEKKKKAHYHFSFAIERERVYFKKKIPDRELIDVTENMIR